MYLPNPSLSHQIKVTTQHYQQYIKQQLLSLVPGIRAEEKIIYHLTQLFYLHRQIEFGFQFHFESPILVTLGEQSLVLEEDIKRFHFENPQPPSSNTQQFLHYLQQKVEKDKNVLWACLWVLSEFPLSLFSDRDEVQPGSLLQRLQEASDYYGNRNSLAPQSAFHEEFEKQGIPFRTRFSMVDCALNLVVFLKELYQKLLQKDFQASESFPLSILLQNK